MDTSSTCKITSLRLSNDAFRNECWYGTHVILTLRHRHTHKEELAHAELWWLMEQSRTSHVSSQVFHKAQSLVHAFSFSISTTSPSEFLLLLDCLQTTPFCAVSVFVPKTKWYYSRTFSIWRSGNLSGTCHSTLTSAATSCSQEARRAATQTTRSMGRHWRPSPPPSTSS